MPGRNEPQEECKRVKMPHSMPRGFLRVVLLRLFKNRELSGMDIINIISERTDGFWQPSPGSIYPLLASLEEDGLIEVSKVDGRTKIYRLSEAGKEEIIAAFRRTDVLDKRANVGPRLWERLLDPSDRVKFNLSALKHHLSSFESLVDALTFKQKKKLLSALHDVIQQYNALIQRLTKEVQQ